MTHNTRLTSKGQATIPKSVRNFLGLEPGDMVRFEIKDGKAVVEPVRKTLLDFRGMLQGEEPVKDWSLVREAVRQKVARKAGRT